MPDQLDDIYFHVGSTFRIRETRSEDIEKWYKWFNDPEITQNMLHGLIPNTREKQEEFRRDHISGTNKIMYAIVDLDTAKLIGVCSINLSSPQSGRRGEISLVIGEKEYHAGPIYLGVTIWQLDHCFYQLNLNSVFAATHERNKVVQSTLLRLGFNCSGVMRQASFKDGKYWDSIYYDLLASEWVSKRGKEFGNAS